MIALDDRTAGIPSGKPPPGANHISRGFARVISKPKRQTLKVVFRVATTA